MNNHLRDWARLFFALSAEDRQVLRGLALARLARVRAAGVGRPSPVRRERIFVFVLPEPLVLGR